jgi:meso-butanediol dehydrogenase/(S,S)-butanediol dehydrogenase/diacetyl reductase
MCRLVVPHFQKQQSGKIVNMASAAAWGIAGGAGVRVPVAHGNLVYGITKAGVVRFTRALAAALAGDNINVNCVCPGVIYTPLWEWIASQGVKFDPHPGVRTAKQYFDEVVIPGVPLKRAQTAEDIGHAVVFLVSEDARNITGHSLNVNGGTYMH